MPKSPRSRRRAGTGRKAWADEIADARCHARDVLGRSTIITKGKAPHTGYLPKASGKASWKRYQNHLPEDAEVDSDRRRMEADLGSRAPKARDELPGIALIPQAGQVHLDWDDPDQLRAFCRYYFEKEGVALTVVRSLAGGHSLHDLPDGIVMRISSAKRPVPELKGVGCPDTVRGVGGYTVGPPSVHPDDPAVQYTWMRWDPDEGDLVSCAPPDAAPPIAPDWFLDWLSSLIDKGSAPKKAADFQQDTGRSSRADDTFEAAVAPHVAAHDFRSFIAHTKARKVVYDREGRKRHGGTIGRNEDLHDFMSRSARFITEAGHIDVLHAYSKFKHRPPLTRLEIARTVAKSGAEYIRRARNEPPPSSSSKEPPSSATDLNLFCVGDVDIGGNDPDIAAGIIPARAKVTLYGPPGSGKTWLAFDLALAISSGGKWGDAFQCCHGQVLLFEGEMSRHITTTRLRALATARGIPLDEIDKALVISVGRQSIITNDRYHNVVVESRVEKAWRLAIKEVEPVVLIIDSLSAFYGAEENSKGFKALDDLLSDLVAEYGITVVIVHHTPKKIIGHEQGLPRGSTVLSAAMDTLLYLDNDKLVVRKQRLLPNHEEEFDLLQISSENSYAIRLVQGLNSKERALWRVEALLRTQDHPLTKREVRGLVRGNNAEIDAALDILAERDIVALVNWDQRYPGYLHFATTFSGDFSEIT